MPIGARRRGVKPKLRLTAAVLLAVWLAVACGGESAVVSPPSQLNGTWKNELGFYVSYADDGTYLIQDKHPGHERERFIEAGTFDFDGTVIVYTPTEWSFCAASDDGTDPAIPGTYEVVTFSEDGDSLTTELVEDECLYGNTGTVPRTEDLLGDFTRWTP